MRRQRQLSDHPQSHGRARVRKTCRPLRPRNCQRFWVFYSLRSGCFFARSPQFSFRSCVQYGGQFDRCSISTCSSPPPPPPPKKEMPASAKVTVYRAKAIPRTSFARASHVAVRLLNPLVVKKTAAT